MSEWARGFAWIGIAVASYSYVVAWMDVAAEHYAWALARGLCFFVLVIAGTTVIDRAQTPKGEEHNA